MSLTGEWINKMRYTYIIEYNLTIKKNELLRYETTWMSPKTSEVKEPKCKRVQFYGFIFSRKDKYIKIESRSVVAWGAWSGSGN